MQIVKFKVHTATRLLCASALVVAALASSSARAAITVCIDKSSPGHDMDQRLVDAVAQQEHVSATIVPFDGSASGDDDGLDAKEFQKLASSSCELVMGFPLESSSGEVPEGLKATVPYGKTGFVLVTPRNRDAATLAGLSDKTIVSVTYMTPPNLYFAHHPNVLADIRPDDAHTLDALFQKKAQAAMVWRASAVTALAEKKRADQYIMHELTEPYAKWSIVALYMPQNEQAAAAFSKAVTDLQHDGKLAAIVQPLASAPE